MNNPNRTPNPSYGSHTSPSSGAHPAGQQPYSHHQPHHRSQSSSPHHHHQQHPPPHHHHQPPSHQPSHQQRHPSHHSQSQQSSPPRQTQPQQQQPQSQNSQQPQNQQEQLKQQQQQQEQKKQVQQMSQEERILKLWSNMRYTVASAFEKSHLSDAAAEQKNKKEFQVQFTELSKNILHFLTYRRDYHRLLSQIEAKLEGKAQERQALETYVRTAPRLGKRKRTDPTDSAIAEETPQA